MRRSTSLGILLTTLYLAAGCGPSLKRSWKPTAKAYRAAIYDDACGLQEYHNNAKDLVAESSMDIAQGNSNQGIGKVTYLLDPKQDADKANTFWGLIDKYYRGIPKVDRSLPIRVKIGYTRDSSTGMQRPVIGSSLEVRVGKKSFTLPPHVCTMAFFDPSIYEERQKLLERRAISK